MIKSVNLISNLVRIKYRVSYPQSNSLFRKVFLVATSGYIDAHKGRIPKRLTVFPLHDISHRNIIANNMKS